MSPNPLLIKSAQAQAHMGFPKDVKESRGETVRSQVGRRNDRPFLARRLLSVFSFCRRRQPSFLSVCVCSHVLTVAMVAFQLHPYGLDEVRTTSRSLDRKRLMARQRERGDREIVMETEGTDSHDPSESDLPLLFLPHGNERDPESC